MDKNSAILLLSVVGLYGMAMGALVGYSKASDNSQCLSPEKILRAMSYSAGGAVLGGAFNCLLKCDHIY